MKINKTLGIAAVVLLALSAWTYRASVQRAERFERGQRFLANLNQDEIAEIMVSKGDDSAHLRRGDEEFSVINADGYPADTAAVNRFVRSALELSLEKRVGAGESLEQELGLRPDGDATIEVVFKDATDKEMVRFLVGNSLEGGSGSYVRREDTADSTIYLTNSSVRLASAKDEFLRKEIVNIPSSELLAIRGRDFVVERGDDALALAGLPAGKAENGSKMSQLGSALSYLKFTRHHLANAAELAGLRFDSVMNFDLADDSGYRTAIATKDDKHYLRIRAFHNIEQLTIAPDASEEEALEKSEILARADEVQKFNNFHDSWIYEISETTAQKLILTKPDLIE